MKITRVLVLALSSLFVAPLLLGVTPSAMAEGAVDAKLLVGTWVKADNPKITWQFNADGTMVNTNPSMTNKGTYKLAGNKLDSKGDGLQPKSFTVTTLSATKLVLHDEANSRTLEYNKK